MIFNFNIAILCYAQVDHAPTTQHNYRQTSTAIMATTAHLTGAPPWRRDLVLTFGPRPKKKSSSSVKRRERAETLIYYLKQPRRRIQVFCFIV